MSVIAKYSFIDGFTPPHLSTERKTQAGFAFALLCLGVIGVISYLSVNRLRKEAEWVRHTEEVISSLRLLPAHVTDVESAQRGYAIAGEEGDLERYHEAQRGLAADLRSLRELTVDNAEQQQRLDAMATLVAERLTRLDAEVEVWRRDGIAPAQAASLTGAGRQLHDQIRALAAEMETVERGLLQQREIDAKRSG